MTKVELVVSRHFFVFLGIVLLILTVLSQTVFPSIVKETALGSWLQVDPPPSKTRMLDPGTNVYDFSSRLSSIGFWLFMGSIACGLKVLKDYLSDRFLDEDDEY